MALEDIGDLFENKVAGVGCPEPGQHRLDDARQQIPAALRDEVLADHRKTADYPGLHHRIAIAQLLAEDGQQGRSLPVLAAGQQLLQSGRNPHDQLVVLQAIEVAEKKGLQTGSDPLRLPFSLPRLDDASRLLEAEKMPALAGMQQLRQGLVRQRQGRSSDLRSDARSRPAPAGWR